MFNTRDEPEELRARTGKRAESRTQKAGRVFGFCVVWLGLFASGCGGPALVPVSGTIMLDEQPLSDAHITFEPIGGTLELVSMGTTNAAGEYTLTCGDEAGAVVGKHRVLITTISPDDYQDELSTLPQDKVPPRYQDGSLTFEVEEGGTNSADFALTSKRR